ncbi:hypothetical protein MMC26_005433 [Xylographa opegraphella]|nr:hypothetical protein [Xylographa opegraphella]
MSQRQPSAKGVAVEYVLVLYGVSLNEPRHLLPMMSIHSVQIPITITTKSWQPVKDLYRKLLRMKPDEMQVDLGAVNLHLPSGEHQFPSASYSFREEKVCQKLFKWLAGNFWHGSQLTAWLFVCEHGESKLLSDMSVTSFSQPINLESISPIKESLLLRIPVLAPPMNLPVTTMLDYQNQNDRYSGNLPARLHSYNSSNPTYSTGSSATAYGQSSGLSILTAVSGQSLAIQQRLQHAHRMSRNHRPGQNGPVWSPYVHSPTSAVVYTTTAIAKTTIHMNYPPASVATYPVTYGISGSTAIMTPYHDYHENPDRTLVNTIQGAVPVGESRAILVRNINHRASAEDVKAYFSSVGVIAHCEIGFGWKDKRKCTAKIVFSNAQEAIAAANRFNGVVFFGRLISTEVAKDDSTAERSRAASEALLSEIVPISPRVRCSSGPLIVDGSEEVLYKASQPRASGKKGKGKNNGK